MPDQNNPTDTTATPTQVDPPSEPTQMPPIPPAQMDIPAGDASTPPPFPPEVSPPEGTTPPPDSGSAAPSFDIPPVITPNQPSKKFGGKRVIATILGLLVLVGGLGAGVILVRQQQDIREKAALAEPCKVCVGSVCSPVASPPNCSPSLNKCSSNSQCVTSQPPPPPDEEQEEPAPPAKPTCVLMNEPEYCVGNNPRGDCYQGGQGDQYACQKLSGNNGKRLSPSQAGDCTCPAPYLWGPRKEYGYWWCFNTSTTCSGQAGVPCAEDGTNSCTNGQVDTSERCSLQPQRCASTPPPGGGPTAQCLDVKAFDTNWTQLTTQDLSALKPGDVVRFTVAGQASSGSFDKARFKINGVQRPEVTGKRPGTEEYYDEYTIPEGITTFTINSQIHHATLGWSN